MSSEGSGWRASARFPVMFGLRLALWYATLFVVGSIAIVFLTYWVAARSLERRDREIINGKLGEYASLYSRGGIDALAETVRAEQRTAPERLFVRVIDTGRTDARVPQTGTGDALDELTGLFNAMLDKIEGLVGAMRGALDNVSHDLRTPLTRLRGTAEIALAGEPDVERCREALADCVEESDRVLVMLNTLMDISEAESGTMRLRREPVSLAAIVARALELYHDVADAKGVTLKAYIADDVVVTADRTRLEQVAANLIDNAVKYTPAGGRADVEVRR